MNTKQENTYELDEHISIILKREYVDNRHHHYIGIEQTFYNDGMIHKINIVDLEYNTFVKIKELVREKRKELEWNSI